MTFQPVVPIGGYAGWRFLTRTLESQQDTFERSAANKRVTDHFRENIAKAMTAEALVNDRQLLQVALGAFGLDEDINARAFILKILEDGTLDDDALANKLADKRYATLAFTFGYGNLGPQVNTTGFADKILARYNDRQFEIAVGNQDASLRQALNFDSALGDILAQGGSENGQWFAVMGSPPLRGVFEAALGLPKTFASLDIDQQLDVFKDRADAVFGTDKVADFADPERQEDLIRLFLLRSEASSAGGYSAGQVALSLLQGLG